MNLRYLWRSLLSVFVLWFALSPALCYASEMVTTDSAIQSDVPMLMSINPSEVTNGYLKVSSYFEGQNSSGSSTYLNSSTYQFLPPFTQDITFSDSSIFTSNNNYLAIGFDFSRSDGANIIDENSSFNIAFGGITGSITGHYTWQIVNVGGGGDSITEKLEIGSVYGAHLYCFADSNDVWKEFTTYDITNDIIVNGYNLGIDVSSLDVPHDVKKLRIVFLFSDWLDYIDTNNCHSGFNGWTGATYKIGFNNSTLSLDIDDGSKGLLNGIIEWLRSIRDGITGVANSITELPNKIWTVMENGIKGLFVPSQEDIETMYNDWETLLRERFGAIYQAGDIAHDFAENLQTQSAQIIDTGGVIEMPSVTANLAGTNFTFGGYTVDIIPNGFEFLADALKSITNIICTVIFINMLRNKLEELIR